MKESVSPASAAEPPAGPPHASVGVAPSSEPGQREKNCGGPPAGAQKKPSLGIMRAVIILGKNPGGLSPRNFAKLMWPDSPRWKIPAKCGPYGCSRGGGMNLAGGGFLGKLAKRGLARLSYSLRPPGWVLTDQGQQSFAVLKAFVEVMK